MWSAITNVITRDLSEFAAVVGTDAAHLLHAAAGANELLITGDEDFPENVISSGGDLDDDDTLRNSILELQRDADTFRIPLTDEEDIQFRAWGNLSRAMDQERWRRLLTESGEIQEAYEDLVAGDDPCCTDDEFFGRYFWRLWLLRTQHQREKCNAVAQRSERKVMVEDDVLDEWDDASTALSAAPPPASAATEEGKPVSTTCKMEVLATEVEFWKKKATALESLVVSLQREVALLTSANETLRQQHTTTEATVIISTVEDSRAPPAYRSPVIVGSDAAAPKAALVPPPPLASEEDDDWANLT